MVDLVHGRQKRGQFDERFRDWPESLHAEGATGRKEAGLVAGESKASYRKKENRGAALISEWGIGDTDYENWHYVPNGTRFSHPRLSTFDFLPPAKRS